MIFERTIAGINNMDKQLIIIAIIDAMTKAIKEHKARPSEKEGGIKQVHIQLMHYPECQKYNQEVVNAMLRDTDIRLFQNATDHPVKVSFQHESTIII